MVTVTEEQQRNSKEAGEMGVVKNQKRKDFQARSLLRILEKKKRERMKV